MNLGIVTPAPRGSRLGNRVTADRYAKVLRDLGHAVAVLTSWGGEPFDALIVLHARRSHASVARWRRAHPDRPLVLILTGTDVYGDLDRSAAARRSLDAATAIVVLQPLAIDEIPASSRGKARTIHQSAVRAIDPSKAPASEFRVVVVGHLRGVKDPFRPAIAARRLPSSSRVRVLQAGRALSPAMERRARAEEARNPRYRWLGSLSHGRALRLIAGASLLVHPSRLEGGANAIAEALVAGIPVLASRVPGNVGMLGADHPGLFPCADARALASLLRRAETDPSFEEALRVAGARRAPLFDPARERRAWRDLLQEIASGGGAGEDLRRWTGAEPGQ